VALGAGEVTSDAVAQAVIWAWNIKPGELVDEGEHVRAHDHAKAVAVAA